MRALVLLLMSTLLPSGQPGPLQAGEFTGSAPSQVVSWQIKRVMPPSAVYVNVNDTLVASAASSITNEVVTVNYRLLRAADGVIVPGQFTVMPTNTRTVKVQQQQLAEGFLLSVSVKAAGAFTRGQTFVRLFMGAGPFGTGEPSYMLMADYITTAMAPGFPNGRVLSPTEGPGWVHVAFAAPPGAGNDVSISVPANARWRVQGFWAQLTTSVTVANRAVRLIVTTFGLGTGYETPSNFAQTASSTVIYSAGAGAALQVPANGIVNMALPADLAVSGNGQDSIDTSTQAIQATDQWGQANVLVEEWLDNV